MEAGKVNVLVAEVHSHSAGARMAAVHTLVAGPDPQAGERIPQAEKIPHIFRGWGGKQTLKCEGATSVTAPQIPTLGASMLLCHTHEITSRTDASPDWAKRNRCVTIICVRTLLFATVPLLINL